MTSHQTSRTARSSSLGGGALGLAALILYLSFHAGGFFADTVALVAVALGIALVLIVAVVQRALAGVSLPFTAGAVAIAAFAVWTLLSGEWSHAPARATEEYDRVLLYLLAFVTFGVAGRSAHGLRWIVRAIAAAAVGVCVCALITRLLPDVWQISPSLAGDSPNGRDRLSYPLTHSNALGALAGIGMIACFGLTSDVRESRAGRVLAAAALPVVGVALLLTFSRGSIAASAIGLVALLAVGRPRALLGGAVAAAATALAVAVVYRADLLDAGADVATTRGHEVAVALVLCVALAAAGRAALLARDERVGEERRQIARRAWLAMAAAAAVGLVVAVAFGALGTIQREYDGFVGGEPVNTADPRDRLTSSGDNGRLDQWRVALDGFEQDPVRGQGAGTFGLSWDRQGSGGGGRVLDAHSLYVETLGELGLVGLLLLVCALLLVLGGFLWRARGPERVVGAALFGCGLVWGLAAGLDWIWEMPAVTVGFFAAGGLALASETRPDDDSGAVLPPAAMRWPVRLVIAVLVLAVLLLPARFYLSEQSLRDGERALERGDCAAVVVAAQDSIAALGARPEPHLLLGYCRARLGEPERGVRAMREAVRNDPDSWRTHYGLAVARAAAGQDPRPAARIARRLRPGERRSADLLRLFDTGDPAQWIQRARRAPMPLR